MQRTGEANAWDGIARTVRHKMILVILSRTAASRHDRRCLRALAPARGEEWMAIRPREGAPLSLLKAQVVRA